MDPVNSTTMSVEGFVEIYGDNQTMMDSQFNVFLRESLPPIVLNIKITKHERWGDCYFLGARYDCLKRLWAEIEVEALDVSEFSVTVTISEDDDRSVTFVGKGHEWFMVALDLELVEVLVRYKVSITMEDFAGNELDPPYEEEVDGWFGGVLRFLEELWDFIVALVSAIAEAVMAAVSFIIDLIVKAFGYAIQALMDGVLSLLQPMVDNLIDAIAGTTKGANSSEFENPIVLAPLGILAMVPVKRIRDAFQIAEGIEGGVFLALLATGVGGAAAGAAQVSLTKVLGEIVKTTLKSILIALAGYSAVKALADLQNVDELEEAMSNSFTGSRPQLLGSYWDFGVLLEPYSDRRNPEASMQLHWDWHLGLYCFKCWE